MLKLIVYKGLRTGRILATFKGEEVGYVNTALLKGAHSDIISSSGRAVHIEAYNLRAFKRIEIF